MIKFIVLLLLCAAPVLGAAQDKEHEDLARRWAQSIDAAELNRIAAIRPDVHISGSHYVDSAYHIGFYFAPSDSIKNISAAGEASFIITNSFYFLRMKTVTFDHAAQMLAKAMHQDAKDKVPAGITNYKVGKLRKGEDQYCLCWTYEKHYTDRSGQDVVSVIRIQYGSMSKVIVMNLIFPDDEKAAQKIAKLNSFASSVTLF
ncbi:MAG: hypothetical protein ABI378_09225 [Chitinophagaceae bacterium]